MKRTKRDQQMVDYMSEMSGLRLGDDERSAALAVIACGKQYGYGNMIGHLRTAWARMLMEKFDFSWDEAVQAAFADAYDPVLQDRLLSGT